MYSTRIRRVIMLIGIAVAVYGISLFSFSDLSYSSNKDGYIYLIAGLALAASNALVSRIELRRGRDGQKEKSTA